MLLRSGKTTRCKRSGVATSAPPTQTRHGLLTNHLLRDEQLNGGPSRRGERQRKQMLFEQLVNRQVAEHNTLPCWRRLENTGPDDYIERARLSHEASFEEVLAHRNLPWNINSVSLRVRNVAFLEEHLHDFNWNWAMLSLNTCMTPDFVKDHFELPWDWDRLSGNYNVVTEQTLAQHPNWPWNYREMSSIFHFPAKCLFTLMNKDWDFAALSSNAFPLSVLAEVCLLHPDKPWDWERIACRARVESI